MKHRIASRLELRARLDNIRLKQKGQAKARINEALEKDILEHKKNTSS